MKLVFVHIERTLSLVFWFFALIAACGFAEGTLSAAAALLLVIGSAFMGRALAVRATRTERSARMAAARRQRELARRQARREACARRRFAATPVKSRSAVLSRAA